MIRNSNQFLMVTMCCQTLWLGHNSWINHDKNYAIFCKHGDKNQMKTNNMLWCQIKMWEYTGLMSQVLIFFMYNLYEGQTNTSPSPPKKKLHKDAYASVIDLEIMSRQEAFRERRHHLVCDFWPWRVTLTLLQGQESLYH